MGAVPKGSMTEVPGYNIDLSQLGGKIDMGSLMSTYNILGQATTGVSEDVAKVLARAEKVGDGWKIELPFSSYSAASLLDTYDKLH